MPNFVSRFVPVKGHGHMRKRKVSSLEKLKSSYGRRFILIWEIGFVLFFLIPLIQSVYYSLADVSITEKGFTAKFIAFGNFRYIVKTDPDYIKNLQSAVTGFGFSLPIIVILSLILAVVLTQKFRGRLVTRAIFFLPVIIATGVVLQVLNRNIAEVQMIDVSGSGNDYMNSLIDYGAVLNGLGFSESITGVMSRYIAQIFNLIWSCGVQIILFIAGLQSIPEQLYEVSRVEGSSKWEEFWFITFPMLSNIFVLVVVYTAVDLFTKNDNPVINQSFSLMLKQQNYDISSAMMWAYFLLVSAITSAVVMVINRTMIRRWE